MNGRELALSLNKRFLPGVRFLPEDFTPAKPYPYAGELCHGVRIIVLDRNVFDAPELGVVIASMLHRLYPQNFKLEHMNALLANRHVMEELTSGVDASKIADDWRDSLQAFEAKRQKALLY